MRRDSSRRAVEFYSWLLRLYPKAYRDEYAEEMVFVFSELWEESKRKRGDLEALFLWASILIDTGRSVITEHLSNSKEGESMRLQNNELIADNKVFLWLVAVTGGLLLLPYWAGQFSGEVDWNWFDFLVMGALIYGMGSLFIVLARHFKKQRALIGLGVLLLFLYLWAELAVGVFTRLGS